MHRLAIMLLIVLVAAPAVAATRPVHVPAPGRGALASFGDLAGSWEGTGTDSGGPYAMRATIGALYGGHFVTLHTVEERGGKALRERLEIWGARDGVAHATIYEGHAPNRVLNGQAEIEGTSLSGQNDTCQVTWTRTADGLAGARHDDIDGETSWSLKRAPRSLEALRRADVEHYEFFDGELKGDGDSAITPGEMTAAHFKAQEFGAAMLSDTIVYSRQTLTYDSGKTIEAVLVHGTESGNRPFRHVYDSRGVTRHFTGTFGDNKQIEFTGEADFGAIRVSLVTTCGGYKLITDWLRPNQPAVWVGYVEMNNVAGSDKALRRR